MTFRIQQSGGEIQAIEPTPDRRYGGITIVPTTYVDPLTGDTLPTERHELGLIATYAQSGVFYTDTPSTRFSRVDPRVDMTGFDYLVEVR